ncbi:FecR family protein [Pseudoflavitalea sp. G-6-1-2]|uniref:FecR family protein n=1 Tax=Pseudoflavitalea sp. G-6-1-2 TaxID=2728841 RepID=UPI00146B19C8|nr:FecR family protein [Pseudoflavitalea sp. G-6-1-2]NML20523.1 FecR family protein [Pseudoflavitalea sp. G-6-1-2]
MDQQYSWQYLIEKYSSNTISQDELEALLSMARSGQFDEAFTEALLQQWEAAKEEQRETGINWDEKFDALFSTSNEAEVIPVLPKNNRKWYAVAAAVALLLSAGVFYTLNHSKTQTAKTTETVAQKAATINIAPGNNGAVLTLADGSQVVLDSAGNGVLAMQGKTCVRNNNGTLLYDEGNAQSGDVQYNTLTTPKGKQFQLILADGTKVWLNAASSIRYPTVFTQHTRQVAITGEAYFEVAHGKRSTGAGSVAQPFIVQFNNAAGQSGQVQVLGTHFNINAYEDEAAVKTTLLEGKVKVAMNNQSVLLDPGQQASVNKQGSIKTLDHADTDAVMAWKNGFFSFNGTDMETMMRQIARWYDVEIEYAGAVPNRKFGGEIPRNSNAAQVLKIMEESEVRFKVSGKKITVLP